MNTMVNIINYLGFSYSSNDRFTLDLPLELT